MSGPMHWYSATARERLAMGDLVPAQFVPPNVQVGAYTLVAADAGGVVEVNSATGVIVTVPGDIFSQGQTVHIVQTGAGQVTLAVAAGLTLNSPTTLKSNVLWSTMTIRFRTATSAVLSGNISAT